MKRTNQRGGETRAIVLVVLSAALAVTFASFTGQGNNTARAAILACCGYGFGDDGIAAGNFHSSNSVVFPAAPIPVGLTSLELRGTTKPDKLVPLPPPGGNAQFTSFFDIFTELTPDPASPPSEVKGFFDITYRMHNPNPPGSTGEALDAEMLSLQLQGTIPGSGGPIPVLIRESPTQQSTGKYLATPMSGNFVQIDSFFDVFTELSLDGGSTFYPASATVHLDLTGITPEPASLVLATIGLGGGALMCRRHRPRWRSAS